MALLYQTWARGATMTEKAGENLFYNSLQVLWVAKLMPLFYENVR